MRQIVGWVSLVALGLIVAALLGVIAWGLLVSPEARIGGGIAAVMFAVFAGLAWGMDA